MLTRIMQFIAIAGLFLALFWRSSEGYELALQFVVCTGALLVAWEAYRADKHIWVIGFAAIAALFNPIQPLTFSSKLFFWLDLLSMATFLVSLAMLKAKPKLSMPSIAY
jgi:hypothetical protein